MRISDWSSDVCSSDLALANGSPCRARPAKTASSPAPPHAAACARAGRDKKTLPPLKVQGKRGGAVPCKGPTPSTSARFGRHHAQTQRLDRGGRRWGEQQYPVELALFAVEPDRKSTRLNSSH